MQVNQQIGWTNQRRVVQPCRKDQTQSSSVLHSLSAQVQLLSNFGGKTGSSFPLPGTHLEKVVRRRRTLADELEVSYTVRRTDEVKLFADDSKQGIGSSSDQVKKRLGSSTSATSWNIAKGNSDRIGLQILETSTEAGHPVLGTTIFEQGKLRQEQQHSVQFQQAVCQDDLES